MPTNTTNFRLIKPGQEEFYNVDVPNANMDTIDGVLKALQDAINSGASEQDLKELREVLATHISEEASLTEAGHVMLSNLINGTSETKAATEKALNNFRLFLAEMGFASWGQAVTNDTDIDTLTKQGLYKIGTTQGNINVAKGLPSGTYHLFVMSDASTVVQLFVGINVENTNKILHRTKNAGAWSSMVKGLDSSMINVPNGVVGLDASGNAPGNITGKKDKIAEVDFAATPGLTADIVIPEGMKKVILEGEVRFEGGVTQNLTLQLNDKTVGNNYHQIRFGTTNSSGNVAQTVISQSVGQSAIYVEIDADSPLLLTRAWGTWNHVVSQLNAGQEVDRLRKLKITAQGTAPIIWGTITVWGEPI